MLAMDALGLTEQDANSDKSLDSIVYPEGNNTRMPRMDRILDTI